METEKDVLIKLEVEPDSSSHSTCSSEVEAWSKNVKKRTIRTGAQKSGIGGVGEEIVVKKELDVRFEKAKRGRSEKAQLRRRKNMTPEQRAREAERLCKRRANMTAEQRAKEAERQRKRRAAVAAERKERTTKQHEGIYQDPKRTSEAERMRRRREQMTPEQREKERQRMRERRAKLVDKDRLRDLHRRKVKRLQNDMDPAKRAERLAKKRFDRMVRFAAMTPEEKKRHNNSKWLAKQARIAQMTETQKEAMLKKNCEQVRNYYKSLTGEKLEQVKMKQREVSRRQSKRNWEKNPEKLLEYLRKKVASETPEQRQKRLRKYKINAAKRKLKNELLQQGVLSPEEIDKKVNEYADQMKSQPLPPVKPEQISEYKPRPSGRKPKKSGRRWKELKVEEVEEEEEFSVPESRLESATAMLTLADQPMLFSRRYSLLPYPSAIKISKVPSPATSAKNSQVSVLPPPPPPLPPLKISTKVLVSSSPSSPASPADSFGSDNDNDCDMEPHFEPERSELDKYVPACFPEPSSSQKAANHPTVPPNHRFTFPSEKCESPRPSWKCPVCEEHVQSHHLSNHFKTHHPSSTSNNKRPNLKFKFLCIRCPWTSKDTRSTSTNQFKTRHHLFKHVLHTHPSNYWPCPCCSLLLYSESSLNTHIIGCMSKIKMVSPFSKICELCGKTFEHQRSYNLHKSRVHPANEIQLRCPKCGKASANVKYFWSHFVKCGKTEAWGPISLVDNPPLPWKKEPHRSYVKNRHSPGGPIPCDQCGKSFLQKSTLDDHIRRDHQGESNICPEPGCYKKFQSAGKLWRHQTEYHRIRDLPPPPGVEVAWCKYCGKLVMRGYEQHVKTQHSEWITDFELNVLPEHKQKMMVTKITNPKKRYKNPIPISDGDAAGTGKCSKSGPIQKCHFCPKELPRDSLKRHMNRKHLDLRYQCPICKDAFGEYAQYSEHFGWAHAYQDIEKMLVSKKLITEEDPLTRQATCQLCYLEIPSDKLNIGVHFAICHHSLLDQYYDSDGMRIKEDVASTVNS